METNMETISSTIHSLALSIDADGFGDDSLGLLVMAHAARDLGISPKTVDVHRANVMRKLMVGSSTELVKRVGALRAGARSNPGASTPS